MQLKFGAGPQWGFALRQLLIPAVALAYHVSWSTVRHCSAQLAHACCGSGFLCELHSEALLCATCPCLLWLWLFSRAPPKACARLRVLHVLVHSFMSTISLCHAL